MKLKIFLKELGLSSTRNIDSEEYKYARPFFVIVVIVMGFIYFSALKSQSDLQSGGRLLLFSALMFLHVFLHWQSIAIVKNSKTVVIYIVFQSILAFLLVFMMDEIGYGYGIIAAMIGVTVGMLRESRGLVALFIAFLLIGMEGILHISGKNTPPLPWIISIPTVLFVVIYVEMYSRQDEARQKAQDLLGELRIAHHELSQYSEKVSELTLQAERERMAFELHDTLGQGVAGIVLQLEAVKNHLINNRYERASEIVDNSLNRARITLSDSRAVIDDLQRIEDKHISLITVIEELVIDFKQSSEISVKFISSSINESLNISWFIIENIKRIVAESLFNIIKHSGATEATINLEIENSSIVLEIVDNGNGFEKKEEKRLGHYGIQGMEERSKLIAASLKISSKLGIGTRVKLIVPIETGDISE